MKRRNFVCRWHHSGPVIKSVLNQNTVCFKYMPPSLKDPVKSDKKKQHLRRWLNYRFNSWHLRQHSNYWIHFSPFHGVCGLKLKNVIPNSKTGYKHIDMTQRKGSSYFFRPYRQNKYKHIYIGYLKKSNALRS